MHWLQKWPTKHHLGTKNNFLFVCSFWITAPQAPGQKTNNSFCVHLPLVSRNMNIKKAIRLECKRVSWKRTETNSESKNKSVICVRSLQPLNHALGVLLFFSTFQVSAVLLLLATSASHLVLAGSHRANTRNQKSGKPAICTRVSIVPWKDGALPLFYFWFLSRSWKMHKNETGDHTK